MGWLEIVETTRNCKTHLCIIQPSNIISVDFIGGLCNETNSSATSYTQGMKNVGHIWFQDHLL